MSTTTQLRLWPGVAAAVLIVVSLLVAAVVPDATSYGLLGFVGAGVAAVLWWLLLSRAPWVERLGAVVVMAAAVFGIRRVLHPSIAGAGMGMLFNVLSIPVMSFALVASVVATRRLSNGVRRATIAVGILLACAAFTLLRTAGVSGAAFVNLHWRWTPTPEERLLAKEAPALPPPPRRAETTEPAGAPAAVSPAKPSEKRPTTTAAAEPAPVASAPAAADAHPLWPGFRGSQRDGIVRDVRILTDWAASPPVELWRRPIGPGWSSFAVASDLLYTQEQRGEDEIVACYRMSTGEPVWRHRDPARFWESNGGAGPRGTPTLNGGHVFAFGATGILNVLDAGDGSLVWSRNAASDTDTKVPYWGFSSSPLVVGELVIVAVSGKLVAYDVAKGERRWLSPSRGGSYSSPQLATIGGVAQVILLRGEGAHAVAPADGALLWEHAWPGVGAIVQPALTADGDVLISGNDMSGGVGLRRLAVAHGPGGWTATERWTSTGLKPYFNDLVVHKGHAFGFDGRILSCVDLADGKRKWKGGRYGNGQMVLLPEQDVLLVLSEDGELALVGATPDAFNEIARAPGIEGKTWNHPVLTRDLLLARNGEQMAAFRLALAGR
jgi:outer membrane protein assembly factor BamB